MRFIGGEEGLQEEAQHPGPSRRGSGSPELTLPPCLSHVWVFETDRSSTCPE
jgi:hypothetical protein